MLSVVGIVFALALSFIDVFHEDFYLSACECFKTWYTVVFCLFIFSATVTILFFVLVIIPRKNKEETLYANYYWDVCKMNSEQLSAALKDYSDKDELVIGQIRINSAICKNKHRCIYGAIVNACKSRDSLTDKVSVLFSKS